MPTRPGSGTIAIVIYLEQPRGSATCGQTCLAMVAGIPLDQAVTVLGIPRTGQRAGTTPQQLRRAFALLGWNMGDRARYRSGMDLPSVALLGMMHKRRRYGHWVAFEGPSPAYPTGLIHDPNLGVPVPRDLFEKYKVVAAGWRLTSVYAVGRVAEGTPLG